MTHKELLPAYVAGEAARAVDAVQHRLVVLEVPRRDEDLRRHNTLLCIFHSIK